MGTLDVEQTKLVLKQEIIKTLWRKGIVVLPEEAIHLLKVFFNVYAVHRSKISINDYMEALNREIYENDEFNFEQGGTRFTPYIRFKKVPFKDSRQEQIKITQSKVKLAIPNVKRLLTEVPFNSESNLVEWTNEQIDQLKEFYVDKIKSTDKGTNFIVFPELTFPIGNISVLKELAISKELTIIAGSYHDLNTKTNRAVIVCRNGDIYEQVKFTKGEASKILEGNKLHTSENILLFESPVGNWIVLICRDMEHPHLRKLVYQAREIYDDFRIDYVFVVALHQSPRRAYTSLNQLLTQELYCSGAFANLSPRGGSFICNLKVDNALEIYQHINDFITPANGVIAIDIEAIRDCDKGKTSCREYISPPLH